MAKILIVYYTRTGNTEQMAKHIAEGAKGKGVEVELKAVAQTSVADLLSADGIIAGSPTYYGGMAAELKKLIDDSVKHHGKLAGKVGAAFSSAANIGGGNETTILAILQAWLIHGMIVPGIAVGDHYGPVSIQSPDERVARQCRHLGETVRDLVVRLRGSG
ncbi:MAG: flavodoxin family protein [Planctomycetota bacterium]